MRNLRSYDPIWMGILTGLAALILWYFSSLAVEKSVTPLMDKIWPFFSAGLGAFSGSYFAYLFRKYEDMLAKLNKRKSALDTCLFTLIRQYNAMYQMINLFEQYESGIERAFSMPAVKFPEYKDVRIDFEGLNFFSEVNEIRHLLALTVEQERFDQTIISMDLRNNFHVNTLQPALEKHNINGVEMQDQEIKRLLGPLIFHTAMNQASTTYDLLCKNLESNYELHQKTWKIAKDIFPNGKFLGPNPAHKKQK